MNDIITRSQHSENC